MQALRARALQLRSRLFPSDSLSRQGIPPLLAVKPLYDRKPVWWTRWTYPMVCANLIVTAYACELTWNHWTTLERSAALSPSSKDAKIAPGTPDTASAHREEDEPKWVLRPFWQRGSFAFGQMLLGVTLSALILGSASRQVRRLYVIQTPKALQTTSADNDLLLKKSLIVQTVHHLRGRGKVIPISSCTLKKGRGDKEVIIMPAGYTGTFWVDLEKDTKIWGKEMGLWPMKQAIYQAFYGDRSMKILNKHGWVN